MKNQEYIDKITQIINSENFKAQLEIHADNFPNLKLENHIRNSLVILFNKLFENDLRALAEYPRCVLDNKSRVSVDFSVCKNRNVDFTMEMKYNFPDDHKQMTRYLNIIRKDFLNRKYGNGSNEFVEAFMLIICETNKEKLKEFEKPFNPVLNSTSQYQISSKKNTNWKINLENCFEEIKKVATLKGDLCELNEINPITIKTRDDLEMKFYFYLLYRQ